MSEKNLSDLAAEALSAGIGVYSVQIRNTGDEFHLEIELEGLDDPRGGVSLGDCEAFSRKFVAVLDAALLASVERGDLPERLTPENYSLEVNSAGAERALRLPADLDRYRGQPLKIVYSREGAVHTSLVLFLGSEAVGDSVRYSFDPYVPLKERGKGKKKGGKSKDLLKSDGGPLRVGASDLIRANLYLDF